MDLARQHHKYQLHTEPGVVAKFVAYSADTFQQLREHWGVSEQYWESLCTKPLLGGVTEKSGKSGSLFWFSQDKRYLLKTITRDERWKLLSILEAYSRHFHEHPESLLSRYFGAYHLRIEGEDMFFVVMNNTFCGSMKPDDLRYDLKGTTEDRWVRPSPGAVLKDLNFADKIIGLKDKATEQRLLSAIEADAAFLEAQNIMDYSVLLGVHYKRDGEEFEGPLTAPCSALEGLEPAKACTLVRNEKANEVVYYVGIIDLLQDYNLKKIAAHVIKAFSIGWVREIDTEPPAKYRNRFISFFREKVTTFAEPNDQLEYIVSKVKAADSSTAAIPCTFSAPDNLLDRAFDFTVRQGGRLTLRDETSGLFRARPVEVEAFLDLERYVFTYKRVVSKDAESVSISCDCIIATLPSLVRDRKSARHCHECDSTVKVEAPSVASRTFTVKAAGLADLRFAAPSRRQMKLWVVALEGMANMLCVQDADQLETPVAAPHPAEASLLGARAPQASPSEAGVPRPILGAGGEAVSEGGTVSAYKTAIARRRRWEEQFLERRFRFMDQDGSGELDINEVRRGLFDLNLDARRTEVLLKEFAAVAGSKGSVGRSGLREVLLHLDAGLLGVVRKLLPGQGETMGALELQRFVAETQREHADLAELEELLRSLSAPDVVEDPNGGPPVLTARGFARLLCSEENGLVAPAVCATIHQDMTRPLTEYWLAASHNTYLEGNQLSSYSSVLQYVHVLHRGCRCVEIDCWDGPDGEPVVRHGYTATTTIHFEDVINAVADHAFKVSPYPVIISLEQRCQSSKQVLLQGNLMTRIFGDALLRPPWDKETEEIGWDQAQMPSPEEAKGKFIVKSNVCCCARCKRTLSEYNRCIFMPTMKYDAKSGEEMEEFHRCGRVQSGRTAAHCSTFNESKMDNWIDNEIERSGSLWRLAHWHQRFWSRSHPKSTRVGSSNHDPMLPWAAGVQIVALNYQTPDHPMLLNEALFEVCDRGCGWVLKSRRVRGLPAVDKGERRISKVKVRVLMGRQLRRPASVVLTGVQRMKGMKAGAVSSPYVLLSLTTTDSFNELSTRTAHQNGFDPTFDFPAEFDVPREADPELCFLAFKAMDKVTGEMMAHAAVPLHVVRPGVRWMALHRPGHKVTHAMSGMQQQHAGLLVDVSLEREG